MFNKKKEIKANQNPTFFCDNKIVLTILTNQLANKYLKKYKNARINLDTQIKN